MIRRISLLTLLIVGLVAGGSLQSVAFAGSSSDDQTIAEDSILTEDDVADYGLEEGEVDDDLPPNVSECKKIRTLIKAADKRPNAGSMFEDGEGTFAQSQVYIFPSAARAQAPLKAYATGSGPDCVEATIEASLEEQGLEGEFSGESIDVGLGDDNVVYQITLTVTDEDGETQEVYLELGLIRVGNGLAVLQFQAPGAPFDGSEDLATIVVDNLTTNLDAA